MLNKFAVSIFIFFTVVRIVDAVNGIYVWTNETSTEESRRDLVDVCYNPSIEIKNIYLTRYIGANPLPDADLQAFNAFAHQYDIRVEALHTDSARISEFIAYQNSCDTNSQKFDAYHMDYEGFAGGEPSTFADIQYYENAITALGGSFPLVVDIGWHWDNLITYDEVEKEAYKHIIDIVYEQVGGDVCVMAYRDEASYIISFAEDEVAYANSIGKQIYISVETDNISPEWNTFYNEGENYMLEELQKVTFDANQFQGFALHYYEHSFSADVQDPYWPNHVDGHFGDKSHVGTGTSNLLENPDVPIDIIWDDDPGPDAIFAANQIDKTPDVTDGLLSYYPSTYWELWIADDDGSFQADVKFHYDNIGGIGNESTLKLYTRTSAGQSWSEVTGIAIDDEGINTDGIGSITVNNLTSLSQFTITSNEPDNPLPVEFSIFTAIAEGGAVKLLWRTEIEVGNVGFGIYRSDIKDGSYTKIAFISGAGNSAMPNDYQFTDEDVVFGKTYYYYIKDVDFTGKTNKSHIIEVIVGKQSIKMPLIPSTFALLQNYPNPFNPETWIPFQLSQDVPVTISIYDTKGQLIRTIALGNRTTGIYTTKDRAAYWEGRNNLGEKVSSGVYFYQLQAGDFTATRRMVVVK